MSIKKIKAAVDDAEEPRDPVTELVREFNKEFYSWSTVR